MKVYSKSVEAFLTLHEDLNLDCLQALFVDGVLEMETLNAAKSLLIGPSKHSIIEDIRTDFNKLLLSIKEDAQEPENNNNNNSQNKFTEDNAPKKVKFIDEVFASDKINLYKDQYKKALGGETFYLIGELFSKIPENDLHAFLLKYQDAIYSISNEYEPTIVVRRYFAKNLRTIASAFVQQNKLNRSDQNNIKDIIKSYEIEFSSLENVSVNLDVRKEQIRDLFNKFTTDVTKYIEKKAADTMKKQISDTKNQKRGNVKNQKQINDQNQIQVANDNVKSQDHNVTMQNKETVIELNEVDQQIQPEQKIQPELQAQPKQHTPPDQKHSEPHREAENIVENSNVSVNQSNEQSKPTIMNNTVNPKSNIMYARFKKLGDKIQNLIQNNNHQFVKDLTENKNENPVYGKTILTPKEKEELKIKQNKNLITQVIKEYVSLRKDLELSTRNALCKYLYNKAKADNKLLAADSLTKSTINTFINKEQEKFNTFTYSSKDRFYKTMEMQVPLFKLGLLTASEKVYPKEKALIVASPKVLKN